MILDGYDTTDRRHRELTYVTHLRPADYDCFISFTLI